MSDQTVRFKHGDRVIVPDEPQRPRVVVAPSANGPLRKGYVIVQDGNGLPALVAEAALVYEADFDPGEPRTAMAVLDRLVADLDMNPVITGQDLITGLHDAGYRVLPR